MIPITSTPIETSSLLSAKQRNDLKYPWHVLTDSGRSALRLVIDSNCIEKKYKRIAVPAYTCPIVWDVVSRCGYEVVLIDVDPETYRMNIDDLLRETNDGLDAIIPTHLFGKYVSFSDVEYCGVPIIEDSAQYLDPYPGPKGDFVFYSFGLGKVITVGQGGALYIRDTKIRHEFLEKWVGWIKSPLITDPSPWEAVARLWGMKIGTNPFVYSLIGSQIKKDKYVHKAPKWMPSRLSNILDSQFAKLDEITKTRRENATLLAGLLGLQIDSTCIYTRFIIKHKSPEALCLKLKKNGIEAEIPFVYPIRSILPSMAYPGAYKLLTESVSLPIHHRLSERDLAKIAKIVKETST